MRRKRICVSSTSVSSNRPPRETKSRPHGRLRSHQRPLAHRTLVAADRFVLALIVSRHLLKALIPERRGDDHPIFLHFRLVHRHNDLLLAEPQEAAVGNHEIELLIGRTAHDLLNAADLLAVNSVDVAADHLLGTGRHRLVGDLRLVGSLGGGRCFSFRRGLRRRHGRSFLLLLILLSRFVGLLTFNRRYVATFLRRQYFDLSPLSLLHFGLRLSRFHRYVRLLLLNPNLRLLLLDSHLGLRHTYLHVRRFLLNHHFRFALLDVHTGLLLLDHHFGFGQAGYGSGFTAALGPGRFAGASGLPLS